MIDAKVKAEKRATHKDMILGMLKKAGPRGCSSEELTQVTWRFSARIFDLKAMGFNIETVDQANKESKVFVLKGLGAVAQLDSMRPTAPVSATCGLIVGICNCHHPRAWHAKTFGACRECGCTEYHAED